MSQKQATQFQSVIIYILFILLFISSLSAFLISQDARKLKNSSSRITPDDTRLEISQE